MILLILKFSRAIHTATGSWKTRQEMDLVGKWAKIVKWKLVYVHNLLLSFKCNDVTAEYIAAERQVDFYRIVA